MRIMWKAVGDKIVSVDDMIVLAIIDPESSLTSADEMAERIAKVLNDSPEELF